jgi:hypothetical protein
MKPNSTRKNAIVFDASIEILCKNRWTGGNGGGLRNPPLATKCYRSFPQNVGLQPLY